MITTMVGSYPKVAAGSYGTQLIGAITQWQRKELSHEELESAYRAVTQAVIREQEAAGLDLLTDGQIRWEDLVTPIARRLEGFEINGLTRWFNNNAYYRKPVLHKKPVRTGPILVEEYRFAARCTAKPVKAVLPAPYTFGVLSEDRYYKALRPFVMKLAEILNEEARALAEAGAPMIQFDDPALGFGKSDVKLALEALAVATRGVAATTAVSTYFGGVNGALEPLMKAKVDVVGLDVVSEPKTLAALKRVKISKALAIGCLDARNTKLESVAEVQAIVRAIARLVPGDRLYLNPNCGLEFLPHPQARAKLKRLGEAARAYRARG